MASLLHRSPLPPRLLRLVRRQAYRTARSWDQILDRVGEVDPELVALDVFDTLVYRPVVGDLAALHLIAHHLTVAGQWAGTVEDYVSARHQASIALPSASLEVLYQHSALASGRTAAVEDLVRTEVAVEDRLLRPIPGAVDALARLRRRWPLVLLSDMHLGEAMLEPILDRLGLLDENDRLVVSCDHGATKSSGELYRVVFGTEPSSTVMIGNNEWADLTVAESCGLVAIAATRCNPTRYESTWAQSPSTIGPVIAGAARTVRLENAQDDDGLQDHRLLGAETIGPMLLGFLLWMRSQCKELGIERLEFLARDGELPLRVAQAMHASWWEGIDLDYLHCGRRSWSLAAAPIVGIDRWIDIGSRDQSSFLLHSCETVPLAAVLNRCRLTTADLSSTPLGSLDSSANMTSEQAETWRHLLRSGTFDDVILERAEEPHQLISRFLAQRQITSGRMGLVDVGWRGHQAWLASALIREATGCEPVNFHFGGDNVDPWVDEEVDIRRFALDDAVEAHPILGPVSCLEMFLGSGKPRLLGYEEVDGEVVEVFQSRSSAVDSPERRALARGAVAVGRAMPSCSEIDEWGSTSASMRHEVRQTLHLLWNKPARNEARLLAPLAFERDDQGRDVGLVATPYGLADVRGGSTARRQWRRGSLAITPQPLRAVFAPYIHVTERSADS